MQWLKSFLYGDDPLKILIGALTEPEAEMHRELLFTNGVMSSVRNVGSLALYGMSLDNTFELLVKSSDFALAREILTPFLDADTGGD